MKIIVTGGCGFIGSHVLDILVEGGHQVICIDILFHGSKRNVEHLGSKIQVAPVDIRNRPGLMATFESFRPDHVYHLAAHHFIPYCNRHPQEAIETNITGTQNVLDACLKYEVERVFFASTAAVYGISDRAHVETEIPDPRDVYGITKAAGEKLISVSAFDPSVTVRIGRYFNAVGLRETNAHIIPEILAQLSENPSAPLKLGNVLPMRDYISAQDLASASVTVLNAGAPGLDIVNIGTGSQLSVIDLVQLFAEKLGRPIEITTDESRVRKVDRPYLRPNITKIKEKYGWVARDTLPQIISQLLQGQSTLTV